MEHIVPFRIQIASIIGSLAFLIFIARLIIKGKLREEYAIIWTLCTIVLVVLSVWRDGLQVMAELFGVYYAPSLVFLAAIFAMGIFLVHLSLVVSKLQNQLREAAQEIALLSNALGKRDKG